MIRKEVFIRNRYNKNLSAFIEMPKGDIKDFIIISHCFTCCKLYKLYDNIAKFLVGKNYGVVRYDAMGLGNSQGEFFNSSFSTNVEDLIAIYDYISLNYKRPAYLFGHSIGGLISIKAAGILDSIQAVVTVGSPRNFNRLINLYQAYEKELIKKDKILVNVAGRNIYIGLSYLRDMKNVDIEAVIKNFSKPIIIFHSKADSIVPYSDGLTLFEAINSEKSFITLENADHLISDKKDGIYIGKALYNWLESSNF